MKIPSAGTPIGINDIIKASLLPFIKRQNPPVANMEGALKDILNTKYCFLVNSGTTAFYIILKVLKKLGGNNNSQKEVILPAYTAPSLVLPIKKLGLSYKLVDMSIKTFNMDEDLLDKMLSPKTLAVLAVHLFGLPCSIEKLAILRKNTGTNFHIIEDAASSFGTQKNNGLYTGTEGDSGFLSFNRGKNLSTIAGGAIITNNKDIGMEVKREIDALDQPAISKKIKIYIEGLGLSLAVRPWFYTSFYPFISRFKHTNLHEDFESYKYTFFQGALGLSLLGKKENIFIERKNKGYYIYNSLKEIPGIRLPYIPDSFRVIFNQFPLIIEDPLKRDILFKKIVKAGIEVTTLYDKPIHKIYPYSSLEDSEDPFPNATYMSKRLLLIPVHPLIREKDLKRVIEIIYTELHK
jgi:perosamine synthetase